MGWGVRGKKIKFRDLKANVTSIKSFNSEILVTFSARFASPLNFQPLQQTMFQNLMFKFKLSKL